MDAMPSQKNSSESDELFDEDEEEQAEETNAPLGLPGGYHNTKIRSPTMKWGRQ